MMVETDLHSTTPPIFPGVLNPRESAQWIIANTSREEGTITIDEQAVTRVAGMIYKSAPDQLKQLDFAECEVHPKRADKAAIEWIFFIDSINFSFWTPDNKPKWQVTHNGKTYSGYYAACAAVNKALAEGISLTSAQHMAQVEAKQLDAIFRGDNGTPIPMLHERMEVLRENGRILLENFQGSFFNVLRQAANAYELLTLIVAHFPNFRDFAEFKGKRVSFLKRAQILVADVENCLRGAKDPRDTLEGIVTDFADISCLTMFADYRVPQALAHLGVLKYSQRVLNELRTVAAGDEGKLLANGAPLEVQLRGFSIAACDHILERIREMNENDGEEKLGRQRLFTAVDVDIWLWLWRREHAAEIDTSGGVPFHRCRSIFY